LHPETRILFHDSEVRRIDADTAGGTLAIRFSAARVHEPGAPGEEEAYLGGVTLALERARWTGPVAVCIGRIASGAVTLGGGAHQATLAIGADLAGALRLELQFANGSQLHVDALRLVVHAEGAARTGDFAC
jgi:hypothetical protein